jgi:hypothetical protein
MTTAVKVMIRIFGDFHHISAEKIGVFLENQCYDKFLYNLGSSILSKTDFLSKIFLKFLLFKKSIKYWGAAAAQRESDGMRK